jgi:hypothetical protein
VDAVYSRLSTRLSTGIVTAIEDRVEQMVVARVEAALELKMEEFSTQVTRKVLSTIDSAVDISFSRAIEARAITMAGAEDSEWAADGLLNLFDGAHVPPTLFAPNTASKPASKPTPAVPSSPKQKATLISPLSPLEQTEGTAAEAEAGTTMDCTLPTNKRSMGDLIEEVDAAVNEAAPKLIRVLADLSHTPPRGHGISNQTSTPTNCTQEHPDSVPSTSAERSANLE